MDLRPVPTIAIGLIVLVLGIVSLNTAWGTVEEEQGDSTAYMFKVEFEFNGGDLQADWGHDQLDEQDGIGLIRAAGPLLVVGVVLAGLCVLAMEHSWLVAPSAMRLVALALAGLSFIFVLLALILMPVGLDQNLEWTKDAGFTEPGAGIAWGAGFVTGLIATTFSLAQVVAAAIAVKGRFRLPELRDEPL